jgi:predicted PurR-regulated permease PerM
MHFLWALVVALVVYVVGSFFDKTPNNKNAGIAAIVAFVLVLLGYAL